MNFRFVKFGFVIVLSVFLSLPVTGGRMESFVWLDKALALSTGSVPFGSDVFVEISKKQTPAVVNVSTKTKTRAMKDPKSPKQRQRQHPPAPAPRGKGDRGGENEEKEERGAPDLRDFYDRFFGERGDPRPKSGMGSGFLISEDGLIMTNNHVIEGSDEIKVTMPNGEGYDKEYDAVLVGTDPKTDIALIRIKMEEGKKKTFTFLKLGDSDSLEVGEWVVAIGNPFGLSHTVTVGVVSAKGRSIGSGPYDEYIQTDASINPGNSGGPLLNIKGEVIGMNTAIISGNSGGNVGIGFAIPINMAKSILTELKEKGSVTRGWLGVMIQRITPELAKSFGLKENDGALVGDVISGGPADEAGIKRGDVISKFNNQEIKTMESLPKYVASVTPGKKVDIEIIRDGKRKTIPVTIAILKDKMAEEGVAKQETAVDLLGVQVQDITRELADSLQLDVVEGVLIAEVTPGEAGAEAGLRRGDVVTEMNRKPIKGVSDYNQIASKIKSGDSALFLVKRGGTTIYIAVKVK